MKIGFDRNTGKQHILSALATLAYDCRRSDFFTRQLYAALQLIDRGNFDPRATRRHAWRNRAQTQFLKLNVLQYGVDGDGNRPY